MLQQFTSTTTFGFRVTLFLAVLVSVTLLGVTGNLAVALAPIMGGLFAIAIWRAPMRYIAHGVLFFALLVDNPTERPGRNLYKSPLLVPGNFLYEALSKSAGVPGLKFTGLELLIILLVAIVGLRMLVRDRVDGEVRVQAATPLLQACLVAMATLIVWWVYGILTGGSVPHSILQMRAMFFMPCLTMFFAYSFKSRRDIGALIGTYMTVGVLRAFMCMYYWYTVVRGNVNAGGESGDGSYVTTHSDSILAAVVIVICIVAAYQHPSLRNIVVAFVVVPIISVGILLNNRRIAFVAVALGLFFCYAAAQTMFRRRVQRTLLISLPILVVYVAAGWKAQGGWAKPVQSLRSVIQQKDTSSATRDIENFNLLQTFKGNPLIGSGFGHEYKEVVQAFDISKVFEAYRYVPHNSVLWFWGVGGVVGFSAYWMFLVIGLYMAARLSRFAESNSQVVIAMAAIGAVTAYASQCFGDMGLMSWMGSLLVSSSLGICASLAVKVGGWTMPADHGLDDEELLAQEQAAAVASRGGNGGW